MRWLSWSATKTLPLPSIATPVGLWNCPDPPPGIPHAVRNAPHVKVSVVDVVLLVVVVVVVVVGVPQSGGTGLLAPLHAVISALNAAEHALRHCLAALCFGHSALQVWELCLRRL